MYYDYCIKYFKKNISLMCLIWILKNYYCPRQMAEVFLDVDWHDLALDRDSWDNCVRLFGTYGRDEKIEKQNDFKFRSSLLQKRMQKQSTQLCTMKKKMNFFYRPSIKTILNFHNFTHIKWIVWFELYSIIKIVIWCFQKTHESKIGSLAWS